MSISKDELVKRKEQIKKDFDSLVEQIKEQEEKIKSRARKCDQRESLKTLLLEYSRSDRNYLLDG